MKKTIDFGQGGKLAAAAISFGTPKNYFVDTDWSKAAGIKVGKDVCTDPNADPNVNLLTKGLGLAGVNNKGTINHFATAFETVLSGSEYQLKFKGVTKDLESIDPKNKNELSGWVPYTYRQLDGDYVTKWVKVTLKTKGALTK